MSECLVTGTGGGGAKIVTGSVKCGNGSWDGYPLGQVTFEKMPTFLAMYSEDSSAVVFASPVVNDTTFSIYVSYANSPSRVGTSVRYTIIQNGFTGCYVGGGETKTVKYFAIL
ncbi:MAG: hypothetical protein RR182_09065 [Alistipes sp.]